MKVQFISEYEDGNIFFNHCLKSDQTPQDNRPHYHDMYEIIFVKEGNISYLTEDNAYTVCKNSLILTHPQQQHCIRVDKNTTYNRYNLLLKSNAENQSLIQQIPNDLCVVCFDSNSIVIQLFEKMDFYCEQLNGDTLGRFLYSLVEEILLNIVLHVSQAGLNDLSDKNPLTLNAIAYINDHLTTLPGVDPLCRHLGISKSYLYQLFQTDMQTTPKQYITERRLNLARQEILMGAKATSIFSQCGFSDYSTFFRAYKKHFGYSPTGTHHASFVRSSNKDAFLGYTK